MRCAACNSVLKDEEIIWRHEVKQWEDLCRTCRRNIYVVDDELDVDSLGIDILIDKEDYHD